MSIEEYDYLTMQEQIWLSKFNQVKTELFKVRRELKRLRLRDHPLSRVSSEKERKKGHAGGKDLGTLVMDGVGE